MMMLSTTSKKTSALVLLVAAVASATTSAESIGLRNFVSDASFGPCTSDASCGEDYNGCNEGANGNKCFCQFPVGSCGEDGSQGMCVKATGMCTREYRPQCGCNGQTFATACTAAVAGVSIRTEGPCPDPEPEPSGDEPASETKSLPGNLCSSNGDCGSGNFCKKQDGDCDGVGTCHKISVMTNRSFRKVCGCNGETYSNGSVAHAAGVNVDHGGTCTETNELENFEQTKAANSPFKTACSSNDECVDGYFCNTPLGDCGGEGTCQKKPTGQRRNYRPVCACDEESYSNADYPNSNGISVDYMGPCTSTDVATE